MGGYVSRANRISAEQLAKRIELDIACGNYDESLERYRSTQQKNDAAYKKLMAGLRKRLQERFNLADHALLGTIEVYGSPICDRGEAEEFFIWLRDERGLAASSRRRYRDILRVVSPELFDEIDIERVPRKLPQPFTKTEVVSILEYFTGTHWGEFVAWQLNTGMRPSETIGLRWQDVDWDSGTVKVESRLRRRQGSSSKRERSSTKTGRVRRVLIPSCLKDCLQARMYGSLELIFTSPMGKPIDDRNFRRRYWKPALEKLGIEYRPPYKCRSTAESHLLASGMPIVDVAAIAGHHPETLMRHYAGQVHRVELPDLYGDG